MKVLIACEESGIVREAFRQLGHDAWSCDLLDTAIPGNHIKDDVLNHLDDGWDLMIAHPPCTHLAVSGARWFKNKRQQQCNAIAFFLMLLNAPIKRKCIENPVGVASWIRKPDQIIQPYMFGHEKQKTTCLWLEGLPKLNPTNIVDKGEIITYGSGRKMAKWYTELFNLPKDKRAKIRSRTFPGIAKAMAEQWGISSLRDALNNA